MTAYFETHAAARASMEAAEEILGRAFDATYETSASNDWVQVVKDSFVPTKICEGLYIVPDWCENFDDDAVNIVLEPGIAFGTGEHPTTRLCLRWLKETLAKRGTTELVVDFGCGSGVLAIGALVMGAKRAVGVDLAQQAVQSSMDNARLNGVEDRLVTHCGDGTDPGTPGANGQAEIVVANILIDPVLELEELLAAYCMTGGEIALSGILCGKQSDSVLIRYQKHFDNLKVVSEDGWACVHGVRNSVAV
jgi:ribosomal protein L11 methyltransferase